MSDDKLKDLAKRSHAEVMSSVDAFVQGFILGRKYQCEQNTQLHNSILREMYTADDVKYTSDNYWENTIEELQNELFELKKKYVWDREDNL